MCPFPHFELDVVPTGLAQAIYSVRAIVAST